MSQSTGRANESRYIGIVADGSTDLVIMARFLMAVLEPANPCKEVSLGQRLSVCMDPFRQKSSKTAGYGLFEKPSKELKNGIVRVIHSAVGELRDQIPRDLSHQDVILLTTDAEWTIGDQDEWHKEPRALIINRVFDWAITAFYNTIGNRDSWEYLPLIIPLVLFPSTDILVAAARSNHDVSFDIRGKKARELKQKLYGCTDLNQLRTDDLEKKALQYLTFEGCKRIYSLLPESRVLLRTLTWHYRCPLSPSSNGR
ncbi:MAG: hypothetical protein JW941_12395 [Candidatus Coatesbacteria bacterium]|nr:hypothetical protein [Candidatus Coatesbacteria bacterium]